MLRITHWAQVKADYSVTFQSGTAGEFCCPVAFINAPAAGPCGCAVEVEVCFEPTAVAEDVRDALVLSSLTGGAAAHQQYVLQRLSCTQERQHNWYCVPFAKLADFACELKGPSMSASRNATALPAVSGLPRACRVLLMTYLQFCVAVRMNKC